MQKRRCHLVALAAALVWLGSGCGGGARPVKVEGKVTLDGKPVEGATVSFMPADESGHPANGRTDVSGEYRLTTFSTADGALPGDYKVIVKKDIELKETFEKDETGQMKPKDKYSRFMTYEKKAGKPKATIPAVYSDLAKTTLKQRVPADGPVNLELQSTAR